MRHDRDTQHRPNNKARTQTNCQGASGTRSGRPGGPRVYGISYVPGTSGVLQNPSKGPGDKGCLAPAHGGAVVEGKVLDQVGGGGK